MSIESYASAPLYLKVKHYIEENINNGVYVPGKSLPSEADFVDKFGVSRVTVRKALRELEQRRILERIPGKGTFVIPKLERIRTDYIAVSFLGLPHRMPAFSGACEVIVNYNRFPIVALYRDGNLQEERAVIKHLMSQDIGGMIITPSVTYGPRHEDNSELYFNVARLGIPIVTMDRMLPDNKVSAVVMNHPECERMAAQWLDRQGIKRVGYLGLGEGFLGKAKFQAFDSACSKLGFNWNSKRDSRLTKHSNTWVADFGRTGILNLLNSAGDIEGLVCFSDALAKYTLEALRDNKVKHNIRYLFTHTDLSGEFLTPELVGDIKVMLAVRDLEKIGIQAAEMLMKQITDGIPDEPQVKMIKPQLIDFKELKKIRNNF